MNFKLNIHRCGLRMNKIFRSILFLSLFTSLVNSQSKTFTREYDYIAGEADSKITSRAIALDQVKKKLLEEVGVYLQSELTITKEEKEGSYTELSKQQIQSIAAGITETKILDEKWTGEKYYIKVSISIDPSEVNKNIVRIGSDQTKLKELEEIKRSADVAYAEIARLKKELAVTNSAKEKKSIQKEYNSASNTLSAYDWFANGYNLSEQKKYYGAIFAYTKAIELNPDFEKAYCNRGSVKGDIQDYNGAITDYTMAIELNQNSVLAFYNRGLAYMKIKKFSEAIYDQNKAIELIPDYYEAYFGRGNAKAGLQDYWGALEDFNRVIVLKPEYHDAYYNRGNAKSELKDYFGAIQDLNKAIELKSDEPKYYTNRGNAKSKLKDYIGDVDDQTRAIELDPSDADYYYNRGIAFISMDQIGSARADFMKRIELGGQVPQNIWNQVGINSTEWALRGEINSTQKKYLTAIIDYTKAIELKPSEPVYFTNRGYARVSVKDFQGGINDFTNAIELKPNDAQIYNNRGIAYLLLGQKNIAYKEFVKATNLGLTIPQALWDGCK
jgi:tetratricopeptide (TPR) repeat protein